MARRAKFEAEMKQKREEIPPFQECEVGLLFGFSCPSALATPEVILGGKMEPFAQRIPLGGRQLVEL